MLQLRGLLVLEGYQEPPQRAPGLKGGGGRKRGMGMPAPPAAKKAHASAPSHKRPYEPGLGDAPGEGRKGGISGEPPQSRPRTDAPQHQLMAGSTGPSGWFSTLLRCHERGVTCLAFSTMHRHLFSGGLDHEVLVWNPLSERVICNLRMHVAAAGEL